MNALRLVKTPALSYSRETVKPIAAPPLPKPFISRVLTMSRTLSVGLFHTFERPKWSTPIFLLCAMLLVCAAVLASGCAVLKDNPATAKLVVQYSVAKFAEQSSVEKRAQRLDNAVSIATAVKAIAGHDTTTISGLHIIVNERVQALHLSPADTLLANALVEIIAQELHKKIGDGLLKPDDALQVSTVMDWVIEAANIAKG